MKSLTDNRESVLLFMHLLRALVMGEPYHFDTLPEEKVWIGLRALSAYHNMDAIIYEQLCLSGVFENVKADEEADGRAPASASCPDPAGVPGLLSGRTVQRLCTILSSAAFSMSLTRAHSSRLSSRPASNAFARTADLIASARMEYPERSAAGGTKPA